MIGIGEIQDAAQRIAGHVVRTPTVASPGLSALLGAPVTTKLELLQRTGSFKARGATAKLLTLTDAERAAGVVAVSGGNHGIALAHMAAALHIKATVVMSRSAPRRAADLVEAAGASLRLTEGMAEAFALTERLRSEGLTLVHPFDDPLVIAGQGTVGLEFAEDLEPSGSTGSTSDTGALTDVLVSIGGGGLAAGVAAAFKALLPGVRVWGVETVGATAMSEALAAGGPVTVPLSSVVTTLSAPSVSRLTYDHVAALVEDVLVVPDAEAVQGVLDFAEHGKVWTEPAAGCLLPAARQVLARVGDGARLGLVVCGGNATTADIAEWARRFELR
ncbi:pyridoxal-phosphate dependent enzyme [Streptomyces caniscabiei]|uniref:Pyridoxal-phosphate dependent enzyme n=1 Tax=Streptomyces caniscabiei TaxID=2746961 RepID=A0A927L0S0_9ACTN|nr:pyridoxal-phosphate dependent enzyme [Streptomyces caniscabiei]MBD9723931.1 pyridoxal-phosphate dependent enzyme [Streptomyces caniscabiei]MDX3511415.1 pyridoxal-phosphate dependent enzyme [Streptomyces caniscabiei]MDX3718404.1 pyridoxal-phosphate dependent enzyme [Streptomyces caniscabiei]MDX3727055.1 pyridoxal-phosphate dependent enzyme [Streptomyces caniscabiei]WEO29811.1 pyridoxal-phosphate dependent enzyme [Streptomyces caniscabiei]